MKKIKFSFIFLLCITMLLTGCGRKDLLNTVIKDGTEVHIYSWTENKKTFELKKCTVEKITPTTINEQIQKLGILPTNVLLEKVFIEDKDTKTLSLYFSENFNQYVNSLDEEMEYLTVTAITNTFLKSYEYDNLLIFAGEESFVTKYRDFSKPLTIVSKMENPFYKEPEPEEEKEPEIINEFLEVSTLFEIIQNSYKGNAVFSPIATNGLLSMVADGASDETKTLITDYLLDVDTFKKNYEAIIKDSDFKMNNVFIHHKGGANVKECTKEFAKLLETYRVEILYCNMNLQKTALSTFNTWMASKTNNEISQYLVGIPKNTQVYICNVNKLNVQTSNNVVKKEFNHLDSTETVDMLEFTNGLNFYALDETTAFSTTLNNNKFTLLCILPKDNVKLPEINISKLLTTKTEINYPCYMPIINEIANNKLSNPLIEYKFADLFNANAKLDKMFNFPVENGITELGQINMLNITSQFFVEIEPETPETPEVPETTEPSEELPEENINNTDETSEETSDEESVEEETEESKEIDKNSEETNDSSEDDIVAAKTGDTEGTSTTEEISVETSAEIETPTQEIEITEELPDNSNISEEYVLNKPFYYLIIDNETNEIIFIGKYN